MENTANNSFIERNGLFVPEFVSNSENPELFLPFDMATKKKKSSELKATEAYCEITWSDFCRHLFEHDPDCDSFEIGDIVSRDGTDEHKILNFTHPLMMEVECIKAPTPYEDGTLWTDVGEIEDNLKRRYKLVRKNKESENGKKN